MAKTSEVVEIVQKLYRDYWLTISNMYHQAEFNGTLADVENLSYLEYEGIEHDLRTDDLDATEVLAILLGQVLVTEAGFVWEVADGRWILSYDEGWPVVAIWPYGRLVEMTFRNSPQYGKYRRVLAYMMHDCGNNDVNTATAEKWNAVLDQLGYDHLRIEL